MSERLQVLLLDHEFSEIRGLAERERLTVAAWVRRALDEAKRRQASGDPAKKVAAIRAAAAARTFSAPKWLLCFQGGPPMSLAWKPP